MKITNDILAQFYSKFNVKIVEFLCFFELLFGYFYNKNKSNTVDFINLMW